MEAERHLLSLFAAYTALLGLWQLVATVSHSNWLVGPLDIARVFLDKGFVSQLLSAYTETLIRSLIGFAGGLGLGLALGLVTGYLALHLGGLFEDIAAFTASIPGVAWIPLLVAIMGVNSFLLPVTASILASFPPIFYQVYSSLRSLDPDELGVARTLGADEPYLWRTIILPRVLAELFPAVKIEAVLAWKIVFAVEMIAATSGLGYLAMMYADLLDVPRVAALIAVLVASVALVVKLVSLLENRVAKRLGLGVEQWRSTYAYTVQGY